jgi:hypothetical protein
LRRGRRKNEGSILQLRLYLINIACGIKDFQEPIEANHEKKIISSNLGGILFCRPRSKAS